MRESTGRMADVGVTEISITAAVAYAPAWYGSEWWSDSTHLYDTLGYGDDPYSAMPKTLLTATLDETLGSVFDRAGDALGIGPGAEGMRVMGEDNEPPTLSVLTFHVGFHRPSDEERFDLEHAHRWRRQVLVANTDGTVRLVSFKEVTYRQLLASQRLALIDGDVTRPYICPSMPQGNAPALAHAAVVSIEAAKAAYVGLEVAARHAGDAGRLGKEAVDDAQRFWFLGVVAEAVRRRLRKRREGGGR